MSWPALAVAAGLAALAARSRARGGTWSAAILVTLCTAVTFSVLELGRAPSAWRAALAFALLGASAWLVTDPPLSESATLPRSVALALALIASVLMPSWLPLALAVVGERLFAALPAARRRTLCLLAALGASVTCISGGQALLGRCVAVFHASLVAKIPDLRHENATLVSAIAVLSIALLLGRAPARRSDPGGELSGAFWLLPLTFELLVLGGRAPSDAERAVLPLTLALAILPGRLSAGEVRRAPPIGLALASVLAAPNGLAPSLLAEEPELARATRMRAAFARGDLLLFPDRPSFELAYYAELPSVAMTQLLSRTKGQKPLDVLALEVQRKRAAGHKVWVNVDSEGGPRLGQATTESKDVGRIVWGVTVAAGGLRMREVRAVTSSVPCASPVVSNASKQLGASANAFVEAELGRTYAPERAIDGDPKTEWLAQPTAFPWLDVSLVTPRSLRGLRILGAQNLPYRDHETRSARIELYRSGTLAASSEVTLAGGGWRLLSLRADQVDCVRVLVLSHRGRGGGLAEVELL